MLSVNQSSPVTKLRKPESPWAALDLFVQDAESKLTQIAETAKSAVDEAQLVARLGLMELEEGSEHLKSKLEQQANSLRQLELNVMPTADDIKLQGYLGRKEIIDAAERTRERLLTIERHLHNFNFNDDVVAVQSLIRFNAMTADLYHRLAGLLKPKRTTKQPTTIQMVER